MSYHVSSVNFTAPKTQDLFFLIENQKGNSQCESKKISAVQRGLQENDH